MSGVIEKIRKHYFNGLNVPKETYSLQLLQDLLQDFGYIPVANSAMAFQSINTICNDILYNGRKGIIEFGSGISTLVIANLIHKTGLECRFYSVENNAIWIDILEGQLQKAGYLSTFNFCMRHPSNIHWRWIKTSGTTWSPTEKPWKARSLMLCSLMALKRIPAIRLARYPAMPFMMDYLDKERYFLLLDDAARPGERDIRKRWKRELGLKFDIKVSKSACCIKGQHFNPVT
ncbi:MAG: hypothetical protein IPL65_02885 [Lewinellaceae bacterium]|nr:hypothetical protein [Lewinellaceae bacterium]